MQRVEWLTRYEDQIKEQFANNVKVLVRKKIACAGYAATSAYKSFLRNWQKVFYKEWRLQCQALWLPAHTRIACIAIQWNPDVPTSNVFPKLEFGIQIPWSQANLQHTILRSLCESRAFHAVAVPIPSIAVENFCCYEVPTHSNTVCKTHTWVKKLNTTVHVGEGEGTNDTSMLGTCRQKALLLCITKYEEEQLTCFSSPNNTAANGRKQAKNG